MFFYPITFTFPHKAIPIQMIKSNLRKGNGKGNKKGRGYKLETEFSPPLCNANAFPTIQISKILHNVFWNQEL